METLIAILDALNKLTPLGVAALLGLVIFVMVYKNPFKPVEKKLDEVKDNHLHELPAMVESLRSISDTLQRIEVEMSKEFSYIKARINGGSK